jgi:hypothetical protein
MNEPPNLRYFLSDQNAQFATGVARYAKEQDDVNWFAAAHCGRLWCLPIRRT